MRSRLAIKHCNPEDPTIWVFVFAEKYFQRKTFPCRFSHLRLVQSSEGVRLCTQVGLLAELFFNVAMPWLVKNASSIGFPNIEGYAAVSSAVHAKNKLSRKQKLALLQAKTPGIFEKRNKQKKSYFMIFGKSCLMWLWEFRPSYRFGLIQLVWAHRAFEFSSIPKVFPTGRFQKTQLLLSSAQTIPVGACFYFHFQDIISSCRK